MWMTGIQGAESGGALYGVIKGVQHGVKNMDGVDAIQGEKVVLELLVAAVLLLIIYSRMPFEMASHVLLCMGHTALRQAVRGWCV
jgi:hypothetical protein